MSTTMSNQAAIQATQPVVTKLTNHTASANSPQQPSTLRPQVQPVIALCGHWGRSTKHTCGSSTCNAIWGW